MEVLKQHAGKIAWGVLGASVLAYEVLAPEGQLLSEEVDRALEKHPVITLAAIGAVALHLANSFDHYDLQQFDIIHRIAELKK